MAAPSSPANSTLNATWLAWLVLVAAGLTWGLTFSLMKIATESGAHPIGLTLWNAILGILFLGFINIVRRRPVPLGARHLKFYAIASVLGTSVPGTAYFYAAIHLPTGVLAITIAAVPMLTFLAAAVMRIDRWSALRLTGVLLGLLAVCLIVLPDTALPDPGSAVWMLAALFSAVCYTAENIYLTLRRPPEVDSMTLLIGMFAVAILSLAPVVLYADAWVPLAVPPGKVELAIILMSVINALAYAAFIYLVGLAGPVFASQMGYLVTLSGVAWGILIFSESHSGWIWAALAAMMAGLALVQPREHDSDTDSS
ncbi:MAG: DMT family transporter [Pseudomonadota bacterium]